MIIMVFCEIDDMHLRILPPLHDQLRHIAGNIVAAALPCPYRDQGQRTISLLLVAG